MSEKLRIGVWIKDGKVFRRDSEKEPYPQVYEPKSPSLIEDVVKLAKELHFGATMPCWTAQIETQQDELVKMLRQKIRETES